MRAFVFVVQNVMYYMLHAVNIEGFLLVEIAKGMFLAWWIYSRALRQGRGGGPDLGGL